MRSRARNFPIAFFAVLLFAGVSHAGAAVDLLWDGETDTLCGAPTSSILTLHIVITAGEEGIGAVGVSVDYSDAVGKADRIFFSPTEPDSIFPIRFGWPYDTGFGFYHRYWPKIPYLAYDFNAACIPGFIGSCLSSAGQSYLLGTLMFRKNGHGGGFELVPLAIGTGDVVDLRGEVITDTTTFNSAQLINVGFGDGARSNDANGTPSRCNGSADPETNARSTRR